MGSFYSCQSCLFIFLFTSTSVASLSSIVCMYTRNHTGISIKTLTVCNMGQEWYRTAYRRQQDSGQRCKWRNKQTRPTVEGPPLNRPTFRYTTSNIYRRTNERTYTTSIQLKLNEITNWTLRWLTPSKRHQLRYFKGNWISIADPNFDLDFNDIFSFLTLIVEDEASFNLNFKSIWANCK
jgi:hypothetical protein